MKGLVEEYGFGVITMIFGYGVLYICSWVFDYVANNASIASIF